MYAIVGASGNTGSVLTEILLSKGEQVRVIGRNPEHLARFTQRGAEAVIADAGDEKAMARAFEGARGVYAMVPPDPKAEDPLEHYDEVGDALTRAIADARVTHVVALSSVGAHLPDRTGPIMGLRSFEHKLGRTTANVLSLRATFFMENLLVSAGLIKTQGVLGSPLRGDLSVSMIATRDIAAAAAESLLRRDFSGKIARELLGQRDLTYNEVAPIVGKAIGKPNLPYVQFPYDRAEQAMTQMGLSAAMAGLLTEMYRSFNEGYLEPQEQRNDRNTTPTSIEEFARDVFAPQLMEMGKGAGA